MKKNSLLENGVVPGSMKCAKAILEKVIPRSWCSFKLSNLPFLSKVLERTVASQLHDLNGLYPKMQSAYCWRYSTETKLLCAYNDLLWALDEGSEALLVLLDLSSAFNTVNHYISLTRLRDRFAITSTVLEWIRSYLTSRSASVRIGTICSSVSTLCNEVPNRFVLGPILFTLYVSPLEDIIRAPDIDCMMYADESQLYTVLRNSPGWHNCTATWTLYHRHQDVVGS